MLEMRAGLFHTCFVEKVLGGTSDRNRVERVQPCCFIDLNNSSSSHQANTVSMTTVFIGKLIKDELKAQQKSVVWLADQLGCNRTNVYKIFNRSSIDTDLLFRISVAMHHNFFKLYTDRLDS